MKMTMRARMTVPSRCNDAGHVKVIFNRKRHRLKAPKGTCNHWTDLGGARPARTPPFAWHPSFDDILGHMV